MDAKTPAQLADDAAEAVRSANHATFTAGPALGWEFPSDAYDVIGHLQAMVQRLPQLLQQTGAHVQRLADSGHVRSDRGGNGADEVAAALDAIGRASADAVAMAAALDTAHSALSPLAWQDSTPPTPGDHGDDCACDECLPEDPRADGGMA
jgi:hypothetical protein